MDRRTLRTVYFALAVPGFLAPGIVMLRESVASGNWFFYADPMRTVTELFVNRTSTAFALDLLLTVPTALLFMTIEGRRAGVRALWRFWLLTAVFGLGGTLPLFLGMRENALAEREGHA